MALAVCSGTLFFGGPTVQYERLAQACTIFEASLQRVNSMLSFAEDGTCAITSPYHCGRRRAMNLRFQTFNASLQSTIISSLLMISLTPCQPREG